ncbi:MAG: rRNA adenine N-6-methyltransferase family protein [Desulfocapsaceae bacterium]|nr:rRNA adenine N-6-methyltransferase family protein [Desulfocapsaceae bacterium]
MQQHTHFTSKLMFRIPDIIGFYSVVEAIRRASDAFLSSPSALFSRALLANPRAMGAACPSSLKLARTIADLVIPPDNDSLILELGGGTGIVTKALLQNGVAPNKLVVVELDRLLARHLKQQFPDVAVIQGNAVKLCQLCNRYERRIGTVVSSLPLLSLPSSSVATLGVEIQKMLGPKGSLVQYTYRLNNRPSPLAAYLDRVSTQTVWCNMPPAKIEVFRARAPLAETSDNKTL